MTSRAERAREDAKLRTLRLIEADPQISQRQLARELGISLGATHYLLRALTDAGMVRLARFAESRKKKDYAYVLTPKGVAQKAGMMADFLVRKREEYEALRQEIEMLNVELTAIHETEEHVRATSTSRT